MVTASPGPDRTGQSEPSTSPLPIACSLDLHDRRARLRRWQHLGQTAQLAARRCPASLEIDYQDQPETLAELVDLLAAERRCCPFLTWTLTQHDVTTTSPTPLLTLRISPTHPETAGELDNLAELFGVQA